MKMACMLVEAQGIARASPPFFAVPLSLGMCEFARLHGLSITSYLFFINTACMHAK
jgi:hypothetical protein